MSSVVTQWSLLDYAVLKKQFDVSHPGAVDNFALLDPARFEAQVNAIVTPHPFHRDGPLDKGLTDPGWSPPALGTALGI